MLRPTFEAFLLPVKRIGKFTIRTIVLVINAQTILFATIDAIRRIVLGPALSTETTPTWVRNFPGAQGKDAHNAYSYKD